MSILILANPWILEVVEAQRNTVPYLKFSAIHCDQCKFLSYTWLQLLFHTAYSQVGEVNATKHSQRNETCRTVVNFTTIQVCEDDGWRENCDANFTQQDAQIICQQLGFSGTGITRFHVHMAQKLT